MVWCVFKYFKGDMWFSVPNTGKCEHRKYTLGTTKFRCRNPQHSSEWSVTAKPHRFQTSRDWLSPCTAVNRTSAPDASGTMVLEPRTAGAHITSRVICNVRVQSGMPRQKSAMDLKRKAFWQPNLPARVSLSPRNKVKLNLWFNALIDATLYHRMYFNNI